MSAGLLLALTCRMGMANAPVLPEPVCARPMTSLPAGKGDAAFEYLITLLTRASV